MTIDDLKGRWYTAKDIKNLFGVSSGQLFYWGQTWGLIKPKKKGGGRAFKDKYSFMNLLDISLIKELNEMGFEPSKMKDILKPFDDPEIPKEWRGNIWKFFKLGRGGREDYDTATNKSYTLPPYDEAGCLVLLGKDKKRYSVYMIDNNESVLRWLQRLIKNLTDAPKSFIIIDLLKIVREVEEKTGQRL